MTIEQHPEVENDAGGGPKLIPYGHRVIVADPPAEQDSGIILPDSAQTLKRGIIVAIPELAALQNWFVRQISDQERDPDDPEEIDGLMVGDVVRYRPNAGYEIDKTTRLLDTDDIRLVER